MLVDHVIPFFCLLACILLALATTWHVKARNSSVLLLMGWLFIADFVIMLNAFIWWSNTTVSGAIWCDISAKLQPAWAMGVPCANLCLARRLYSIASTKATTLPGQRRGATIVMELAISILLPLIYAVLAIVYQGHRYDIVEGIGCLPSVVVTTPYIILGVLPPLLAFLVNLFYSTSSIRYFLKRQKQFNAVLNSSGANMNRSRYVRMMTLCIVEIAVNLPILVITQILSIPAYRRNYVPYISWANVHYGFNAVIRYDATLFDIPGGRQAFAAYTLGRWVAPLSSILVFLFFGMHKDALKEYKKKLSAAKESIISHLPLLRSSLRSTGTQTYTHEMPRLGMHDSSVSHAFADYPKDLPTTPSSHSTGHQDDKALKGVGIRVEHTTS